jgi:hypothetical protein
VVGADAPFRILRYRRTICPLKMRSVDCTVVYAGMAVVTTTTSPEVCLSSLFYPNFTCKILYLNRFQSIKVSRNHAQILHKFIRFRK